MANGSLSSNSSGEGDIRKAIIDRDLVDCIVAMPAQLFLTTGIPVCLWFISRDKTGRNIRHGGRNRRGETLFIDARQMGTLQTRVLRVLSGANAEGDPPPDSDIGRIVRTYHAWRGEEGTGEYADEPGFCKAATLEEIEKHGHVLTPGRYVGAAAVEDDGEPFEDKMQRLTADLQAQFAESDALETQINANLEKLGYGD